MGNTMTLIEGFENIVRENEPLAPYTSLRVGGVAEFIAEPTTVDELQQLVQRFVQADKPVRLLGGGSNILVRDEGVSGLVLLLSSPAFCSFSMDGNRITVGGGTKLSHMVSAAVGQGFAGPEYLVGIPGTVGGALHGNSGSQQADIGSWVKSADVMTLKGDLKSRGENDLNFAYRQSSLNELAIINATFEFEMDDPAELTKRMQKLWIVKKANQPEIDQNAAYVFKDIGGESARDLIERAGLKGTRIGGVEICNRDANFFVTEPGAKSSDVLRLIDLVKTQINDRLDVELQLGLEIW